MIIVDTSSLVAVVLAEPDATTFMAPLKKHRVAMTSVGLVEAGMVVESRVGLDGARDLDRLIELRVDEVMTCDRALARAAMSAWRRFGKGRHPAALNFGDCFSYAAAAATSSPLLFKGNDFSQTDIMSVL